jgi:putative ABC transport system permease protein
MTIQNADRNSVYCLLIRTINVLCSEELCLVLKVHVAEYRNKPLLNFGFILSLATATTTLLCILVLNHASRQQYRQANELLTGPIAFHIVADQGARVNKSDFATLRKQGFTQITPTLTFRKKLANGKYLSFRAIDMLALSIAMPEQFDSQAVLLTKAQLDSLSILLDNSQTVEKEQIIVLADKTAIPFRITTTEEWVKLGVTDVALLDIALAWQLFPKLFPPGEDFSYLMVAPLTAQEKQQLMAILPPHLSIYEPWSMQERQGFADALHLNLSALAILGFIVSMFIAFQAGNQAWNKRSELAAQLRLFGVRLTTIKHAMLVEALFLIVASGLIGIMLSVALVVAILPLLGLTLNQLYSLNTSGHFDWQWKYALWAFTISSIAVLLALMKQFKRISSVHVALLSSIVTENVVTEKFPRFQTLSAAAFLLLLFILWPSTDWYQIMAKYGLLLIASVALLPNFLQLMLYLARHLAKSFRFSYMIKDASSQVKRRYLPLAAFYLALSASITAALMVNSFELAFVKYLNQQLSSDLFIRHQQGNSQQVKDWLEQKTDVDEYILFQHTWGKVNTESVRISTYQSPRQLPALRSKMLSESTAKTAQEKAVDVCYINEQLALKNKLSLAETISITQGDKTFVCEIKGIYYQYGNPGLAVTLHQQLAQSVFTGWVETGIGVFFKPGYAASKQSMITDLGLKDEQVYEPTQIKNIALNVFAKTFLLTQAIVAVLLAIACFGLFMSANSLELARKSDLYILRSLGYSNMELFAHMLMQWLLLAIGTILLSWPVAIILANALVSQALPASFGWSMPLVLNTAPFVVSSVVGLLFLLPALCIPLLKLNVRSGL